MVDQNSQFYAILTNVGAAKQANADALGIAWKITHMGVGDANGTDPTPNANQASLINEWRRAPLNQLKVDDKNSAIIVAEQVIPADVGGRWIREIALYDADGDMVAVANCAPTYKPLLSQGSGRTQVVRMNLIVSSSSNVELKIDPSVVLATREWVTEELAKQDFKHSVQAATTTNIALSGLQSVDGVSLGAGARVLVKNQTAGKDNGLYTVAAGTWKRCPDADTNAKVTPGLLVLVERGAVNGDSAWQMVTDAPVTLGVTTLIFEMAFGRTGVGAGTYRSVTVDAYGRVLAATNPTTVMGYGLTDVYTKAQIDQVLALKAPLASPALTGIPSAPTAPAGTNTTQVATTAFVRSAISALVGSSPTALDTLNELAAALGNDPNFAATMNSLLAEKVNIADKASQTFAEGGVDDNKWMTSLGVRQSAIKRLNEIGLAALSAPIMPDFKFNNPAGLYIAYAGGTSIPTPNGPPSQRNNIMAVLAMTPRPDGTYYLVVENSTTSEGRRLWLGQYNKSSDILYWSSVLTTDQIATQDEVNAGDSDQVVVTPKKMRWGFAFSFSSNGYFVFPSWMGGFIIQWANGNIPGGVGSADIKLPLAFPSNLITYSIGTSSAGTIMTGQSASPSGITVIARTIANGALAVPSVLLSYTFICMGR